MFSYNIFREMSSFLNETKEFPDYENLDSFDALNTSLTAEPLATFDLTPASGSDGMIFNLTPVKNATPPATALVSPSSVSYEHINPMYNRQLSNTINAMTFTPPPAPSITPDFTGLLPPPPPPSLERVISSRPPPQLLSISRSQPQHLSYQQHVSVSAVSTQHVPSQHPALNTISSSVSTSPQHRQEFSPHHSPQQPSPTQPPDYQPHLTVQSPRPSPTGAPGILSPPHSVLPPPYKSPPNYPSYPAQTSPNSVQIAPNVTLYKKSPLNSQHQPTQASRSSFTLSQDDSIMSPPPAPPPPYTPPSSSVPTMAKLPSYSLEELKDLPGANLKKSSVDLNVYIAAMAKNTHPDFENIDNFAERCLACIVRKIKTNLPTLRALLDSSMGWQGDRQDPGCVLIPRMKDGRITIARPGVGAGGGGTKKIHPHLALVQIFKNPLVTNHNTLTSVSHCAAPFISRNGGGDGDGDVVCISPMHYSLDTAVKRSPVLAKKKPGLSINQLNSSNVLLSQMKIGGGDKPKKDYLQLVKSKSASSFAASADKRQSLYSEESDVDFWSDSDDDGVDWIEKWNNERRKADTVVLQRFNVEEQVKDLKIFTVNSNENNEDLVKTDEKLIEKLHIIEDFSNLMNGKYELQKLKDLQKIRIKDYLKPIKMDPQKKKPGPKPKKKPGETWISNNSNVAANNKVKRVVNQFVTNELEQKIEKLDIVASTACPVSDEDKEETVIHNLLEDIKGSFESQFDMDLDSFGNTDVSSGFEMSTPFNLSGLSGFPDNGQSILQKSLSSTTSDAMFGGGTEPINLSEFDNVQNWSNAGGSSLINIGQQVGKVAEPANSPLDLRAESLMDDLNSLVSDQHAMTIRESQRFYNPSMTECSDQLQFAPRALEQNPESDNPNIQNQTFLPPGTMSQDQFFNIFDDE